MTEGVFVFKTQFATPKTKENKICFDAGINVVG